LKIKSTQVNRYRLRPEKYATAANIYAELDGMPKKAQHFKMVDITGKKEVFREAVATGRIKLKPSTITLIKEGKIEKGNPLAAAEIAAVLAAKNTSQLIPFCHSIPLTSVQTKAKINDSGVEVEALVRTKAGTGVEMEALSAATAYLLTVWDVVKKYEKDSRGQYPETAIEYVKVKQKVKSL